MNLSVGTKSTATCMMFIIPTYLISSAEWLANAAAFHICAPDSGEKSVNYKVNPDEKLELVIGWLFLIPIPRVKIENEVNWNLKVKNSKCEKI